MAEDVVCGETFSPKVKEAISAAVATVQDDLKELMPEGMDPKVLFGNACAGVIQGAAMESVINKPDGLSDDNAAIAVLSAGIANLFVGRHCPCQVCLGEFMVELASFTSQRVVQRLGAMGRDANGQPVGVRQ